MKEKAGGLGLYVPFDRSSHINIPQAEQDFMRKHNKNVINSFKYAKYGNLRKFAKAILTSTRSIVRKVTVNPYTC